MDKHEHEALTCRLFFYAVLPCLEHLLVLSPEAKAKMSTVDFSLCFKTTSGLRSCLQFKEGFCQFYGPLKTATDIELLFFSESQANCLFQKKRALPPLPTRGLFKLKSLLKFKAVAELLETYLEPSEEDLKDETFKQHAIELMFTAAVASVCQLGAHESHSKKNIAKGPQGTVCFKFESAIRPFWFRCVPGDLQWGRGEPSVPVDATVLFKSNTTALGALQDTIVSQAEVGLGNIEIAGMYPLADHISLLLERVPLYLASNQP